MDIDDIIYKDSEYEIKQLIKESIEIGMRLQCISNSLGREPIEEDLNILISGHVDKKYNDMYIKIETILWRIPGFKRLCKFCEGELDCGSDHK